MSQYQNELEQYDKDFNPSPGRRPNLEVVPDGTWDFEVVSADLGKTEKTNDLIFRLGLRVLNGPAAGSVVESPYFFRSQQNVDILGSDLCTLGIDADQWKAPARPFSRELPAACPRLAGVCFRGKKHQTPDKSNPSKIYHNLYVNQRIERPTAAPTGYTPPFAGDPFAGNGTAAATTTDNEVPF